MEVGVVGRASDSSDSMPETTEKLVWFHAGIASLALLVRFLPALDRLPGSGSRVDMIVEESSQCHFF